MKKRTVARKTGTTTTDLEESQLAALIKRLDSGKPLTAAQMAFVQRCHATPAASGSGDVAPTVAELARRLGVDRRTVTWHRGRDGAPQTLSVSEWRGFLWAHGKGATLDLLAGGASTHRDTYATIEQATLAQFHAVSGALPLAFRAALESEGVSIPARKVNAVVFRLWLALAGVQQTVAERQGVAGVLDANESGCDYPEAIRKLAAQVG